MSCNSIKHSKILGLWELRQEPDLFLWLWLTEDFWDVIQTDVYGGDSRGGYRQQGVGVSLQTTKILSNEQNNDVI